MGEIQTELSKNRELVFNYSKQTPDGITAVRYHDNLTDDDRTFILKDDTCVMYSRVANKQDLINFIERLNEGSTKVSDNVWIDQKNEYKIELRFIKGNPYYSVNYTKI